MPIFGLEVGCSGRRRALERETYESDVYWDYVLIEKKGGRLWHIQHKAFGCVQFFSRIFLIKWMFSGGFNLMNNTVVSGYCTIMILLKRSIYARCLMVRKLRLKSEI